MKSRKFQDMLRFFLLTIIVVLLNVIGQMEFFRIDLTAEKRYSLSEATKNLLDDFEDEIFVRVYLKGEFPAGFVRLQRETRQMLDEFRAYNPNLQYVFENPLEEQQGKEEQDIVQQLQSKGIKYFELQVNESGGSRNQKVFPGALLHFGDKEVAVNLLLDQMAVSPERQINSSVQNLEFALANGIRSLVQTKKPRVAFLQGQGELGPRHIFDWAQSMRDHYQVSRFNLRQFRSDSTGESLSVAQQMRRLNRFDAVIVAKPEKAFNDLDKYLIDQYIMRGGKVLWFIDAVKADMDSLSEKPQFMALPAFDRLNLSDMLFRYGVRLNTNLVQDMVAAGVSDTRKTYPWIYFPMIMPQVNHPIAKDLNAIKLEFPSTVDTVRAPGVRKTTLLKSSRYSRSVGAPHIVRLGMLYEPPGEEYFNQKHLPLAVLLEGEFTSAFKNRVQPRENSGENLNLIEKSPPTHQLVVADGDIVRNQLNVVNPNIPKGTPLPLGHDQYTGAQYGNKDFLLNAIDYMLDDSGLIEIRSRELSIRLLDTNLVRNQEFTWQLINTALPMFSIALLGLIYIVIRKRKYSGK